MSTKFSPVMEDLLRYPLQDNDKYAVSLRKLSLSLSFDPVWAPDRPLFRIDLEYSNYPIRPNCFHKIEMYESEIV